MHCDEGAMIHLLGGILVAKRHMDWAALPSLKRIHSNEKMAYVGIHTLSLQFVSIYFGIETSAHEFLENHSEMSVQNFNPFTGI